MRNKYKLLKNKLEESLIIRTKDNKASVNITLILFALYKNNLNHAKKPQT